MSSSPNIIRNQFYRPFDAPRVIDLFQRRDFTVKKHRQSFNTKDQLEQQYQQNYTQRRSRLLRKIESPQTFRRQQNPALALGAAVVVGSSPTNYNTTRKLTQQLFTINPNQQQPIHGIPLLSNEQQQHPSNSLRLSIIDGQSSHQIQSPTNIQLQQQRIQSARQRDSDQQMSFRNQQQQNKSKQRPRTSIISLNNQSFQDNQTKLQQDDKYKSNIQDNNNNNKNINVENEFDQVSVIKSDFQSSTLNSNILFSQSNPDFSLNTIRNKNVSKEVKLEAMKEIFVLITPNVGNDEYLKNTLSQRNLSSDKNIKKEDNSQTDKALTSRSSKNDNKQVNEQQNDKTRTSQQTSQDKNSNINADIKNEESIRKSQSQQKQNDEDDYVKDYPYQQYQQQQQQSYRKNVIIQQIPNVHNIQFSSIQSKVSPGPLLVPSRYARIHKSAHLYSQPNLQGPQGAFSKQNEAFIKRMAEDNRAIREINSRLEQMKLIDRQINSSNNNAS